MSKDQPTPEELDAMSNKVFRPDEYKADGTRMSFTEYVEHLKETNPDGGDTNSG